MTASTRRRSTTHEHKSKPTLQCGTMEQPNTHCHTGRRDHAAKKSSNVFGQPTSHTCATRPVEAQPATHQNPNHIDPAVNKTNFTQACPLGRVHAALGGTHVRGTTRRPAHRRHQHQNREGGTSHACGPPHAGPATCGGVQPPRPRSNAIWLCLVGRVRAQVRTAQGVSLEAGRGTHNTREHVLEVVDLQKGVATIRWSAIRANSAADFLLRAVGP